MKSLSKTIKLVMILLLTGTVLCAQDVQRFLGTYSITAMCKPYIELPDSYLSPEIRTITIEEGIESNLLIHISGLHTNVKAFVLNDTSFVIPEQIWKHSSYYEYEDYLSGSGTIRNDSICLSYAYRTDMFLSDEHISTILVAVCGNCREASLNIVSPTIITNKVYYDAINQIIVVDADLQNQSLALELYDMQGRVILRETNPNNCVNIANLPSGVYLYRLLKNSQEIYFGKILK